MVEFSAEISVLGYPELKKGLFLENVCLSCLFGSSSCACTTVPIFPKFTPNIFGSTYMGAQKVILNRFEIQPHFGQKSLKNQFLMFYKKGLHQYFSKLWYTTNFP